MSVLEVNLLGVPEVRSDGTLLKVPAGKTLALLAYLAVEGGMHPREEVVALLWPDVGEQEARACLRTALTVLRKALSIRSEKPEVLRTVSNAIGLEPAATEVDVHVLETAAALARQREATPGLRVQLERAVAAARGPLLTGVSLADAPDFATWLLVRREASHRRLAEVLAHLASLHEATGDLPTAITTLEQWVRHDPLEEQAHSRLIAAHAATGDSAAGLRAYEECRTVMGTELGIEPSLEIQALAEQLQSATRRLACHPMRHSSTAEFLTEP
ncbi:MAG: hypothetical protein JWO59_2498, partial [Chloroflexi bacterium]|nr:hypothetical protein [Chloroflexota bacterium]